MRTRCLALVAVYLFIANFAAAETPSAGDVQRKVDQLAANELKDGPTAGLSVLVAREDTILVAKSYGFADIDGKVQATEDTVYRLGSLSKQFTAAAALKLVDDGRLKLDESIRTYLKDYPEVGQPVTIRHLLNHTSGLVNYTAQGDYWKHMNDELSHQAVVDLFASRELTNAPGERYIYNNSGYFLLGQIIEKVSGLSFADYVQKAILDPLQLKETYYDDGKKTIPNHALGYARDGKKLVPAKTLNMDLAYSAGAMASSVKDIYALHQALRAGKLVSPESYKAMTSPATLNDGKPSAYGMGFHVDDWDGHRVLRHGGLIFGFKTCCYYYPEQDLTVIILMNTEDAVYRPMQSAIARMFIPDLPDAIDTE